MKANISSELLSKIDKNETPISWLYKIIFFDDKWNWYIAIILWILLSVSLIVMVLLFDEVIEMDLVLIYLLGTIMVVFYLRFREKIFLKIYNKELYLNHFYDNE